MVVAWPPDRGFTGPAACRTHHQADGCLLRLLRGDGVAASATKRRTRANGQGPTYLVLRGHLGAEQACPRTGSRRTSTQFHRAAPVGALSGNPSGDQRALDSRAVELPGLVVLTVEVSHADELAHLRGGALERLEPVEGGLAGGGSGCTGTAQDGLHARETLEDTTKADRMQSSPPNSSVRPEGDAGQPDSAQPPPRVTGPAQAIWQGRRRPGPWCPYGPGLEKGPGRDRRHRQADSRTYRPGTNGKVKSFSRTLLDEEASCAPAPPTTNARQP